MNPLTRGRLFALGAALSYGTVTTLAKLAYEGGGSPQTVIWLRFVIAFAGIGLLCIMLRSGFYIPRRCRLRITAVAFCWSLVSIGHLGAVYFIPVGLAGLIFYTFPLQILLFDTLVRGRRLFIAPFVLAFIGLAMTLGPDFSVLDRRGVALAVIGSVAAAGALLLSEKLVAEVSSVVTGFWMQLLAAFMGLAMFAVFGDFTLPATNSGAVGLIGAGLVTVFAIVLSLTAIRSAGAAQTGLVLNFEPIVIFCAAALLLGEQLTVIKLTGAALVVSALAVATLMDKGKQGAPN